MSEPTPPATPHDKGDGPLPGADSTEPRGFWRTLLSKDMLLCVLMGFSSGMPLYLLFQMIPAWMADQGVDLKKIGLMALVGIPYTWKFVWAPLLDRFVPIGMGRRRGWALISQIILLVLIGGMGLLDPTQSLSNVAYLAVGVAFFSASQDIVLDAYRRELLPDEALGLGNSMFVNGYRISALIPGGLALILADRMPWNTVFLITAAFMSVGMLATILAPNVATDVAPPKSLKSAIIDPFVEFFTRKTEGKSSLQHALLLLGFLLLYKLGDSMATALITPFYLDVGFTKTEIGTVAKMVGLWSTIIGAFVGGAIITKIGINRSLWAFGVVQMVSILGFAALNEIGHDLNALSAAVAFEYLGVGLGTAAFLAFMAKETNKSFTATQFALFSSLIALPRTFMNAGAGFIVDVTGWTTFFLMCTALAVPGMLLLPFVAPWNEAKA